MKSKRKIKKEEIEYKFVTLVKEKDDESILDKDYRDSINLIRDRKNAESKSLELLSRKEMNSGRIRNIRNKNQKINYKKYTYDYQGKIIPIHYARLTEIIYDPKYF